MKQVSIFFLVISFAVLVIIGCAENTDSTTTDTDNIATFDLKAVKKIIQGKSIQFTEAHITKDTAFLNSIFTQDAKVFPPNSDVVIGRSAIAELNSEWVNYGIKEFSEETTSFYGCEDYVIDEGTFFLIYGKYNTVDKGKYLNVWKKEDGEWKMFSNIWNTSMPAIPAE
ncbi:MAG: nuclear transport factor 2 family protein [Melioribacteraceae bacterium]|nr:nuclear transport factor 2 family protein [Melioribacteraceae bacterium]